MAKKNSNGEGSISKRSDGRWCGRITTGYDANGKQKRKSLYGKTKKEVLDKMTALQHDILMNDGYVRNDDIILSIWLRTYLFEYKRVTIRPSSFERIESVYRVHIQSSNIGNMKLKDIKPFHIQIFMNEKSTQLSPSSLNKIFQLLNQAFEHAVINDLIRKSPVVGVTIPQKQIKNKEIEVFTRDEQKAYMHTIESYTNSCLYLTALFTGMRVGELMAITWDDIDWNSQKITVCRAFKKSKIFDVDGKFQYKTLVVEPKTVSGFREIPITNFVLSALKSHRTRQQEKALSFGVSGFNPLNLVFPSEVGTPLSSRNILRTHELICKRANIRRTTVHSLRHTFATRMLESGVDAKTVQYWLGHSSVELTLNVYVHVQEKAKLTAIKQQDSLYEELMI